MIKTNFRDLLFCAYTLNIYQASGGLDLLGFNLRIWISGIFHVVSIYRNPISNWYTGTEKSFLKTLDFCGWSYLSEIYGNLWFSSISQLFKSAVFCEFSQSIATWHQNGIIDFKKIITQYDFSWHPIYQIIWRKQSNGFLKFHFAPQLSSHREFDIWHSRVALLYFYPSLVFLLK